VGRSTIRLRDRPALAAQIAALSTEVGGRSAQEDGSSDFPRGALNALEWVTHGGPGPLTGMLAMVPVTGEAMVGELAATQDIIYGPPSRHRDYARGVEHALMWAQFATAAPPLPRPEGRVSVPSRTQRRPQ
jgi:hypothetical protein